MPTPLLPQGRSAQMASHVQTSIAEPPAFVLAWECKINRGGEKSSAFQMLDNTSSSGDINHLFECPCLGGKMKQEHRLAYLHESPAGTLTS